MSMVHICHGQNGVGIGVRGAAAFWAWNQVQVLHCQTASSMALLMPGQKTHPWWMAMSSGMSGPACGLN